MAIILNTRRDITLEACHAVAWRGHPVKLSAAAIDLMTSARQRFMSLINDPDVTIYGVTSGYGQNAKRRLIGQERKAHAKAPPVAATSSWGDPVPERVSRAIVLARLANFIDGHSCISPHIAIAVADLLGTDKLPVVPARGQGGAGEIMSLSHLFLPLARAHDVGEKDVLSLINGSPAASGLAADAALAGTRRAELCCEVMAFAAEAFNTPLEHFSAALDDYWNNAHDAWALSRLRGLIGDGHGGDRRPYQAPVCFRIMPRILAQVRRAALLVEEVARESLCAVTDNPVVLPPDETHPHGLAISTGGYHNPHMPLAVDALTSSYVNLATIAERMSAKMLDGSISLLPPQLGAEAGLSYLGCIPMALTGYGEEMRMLAQPTLLPGSESGGFGQNDVASPVFLAWSKQERAGLLLEQSLAGLAAIAARAYRVTGRPVPKNIEKLSREIASCIPDNDEFQTIGPPIARLAEQWRNTIYES